MFTISTSGVVVISTSCAETPLAPSHCEKLYSSLSLCFLRDLQDRVAKRQLKVTSGGVRPDQDQNPMDVDVEMLMWSGFSQVHTCSSFHVDERRTSLTIGLSSPEVSRLDAEVISFLWRASEV